MGAFEGGPTSRDVAEQAPASARSPWRPFFASLTLVVLLCVSALFAGIAVNGEKAIEAGLLTRARTLLNAIVLARTWNATHGGVLVEKTPGTQSNPYLPDADVRGADGKVYTRKNPALMAREISEIAEREGAFRFHITSLRPLNPGNVPDAFEALALADFERGGREAVTRETRGGSTFFRYMAPLRVEQPCLRCHASQGYSVGDVRGGISVTFNVDESLAAVSRNRRITVGLFLLTAILLVGVLWRLVAVLRRRLAALEARIREMATTDELTGLWNRRHMAGRLEEETAGARRYREPLSCVLFDVDGFKRVNDTFGHPAGDALLRALGATARSECRRPDLLGRWGGEEFLLLLPSTDAAGAAAVAGRMREVVEALRVAHGGQVIGVTASFGVAALAPGAPDDGAALLRRADEALYRAKAAGRNRVEVAG